MNRRTKSVEIKGRVNSDFQALADEFGDILSGKGEVGASCALYLQGKPVVDIWGGHADREADKVWQEDSLQLVFSATKAVTSTCIHHLVESGKLDVHLPIAHYWPEFGRNGKEDISAALVLSHRAGMANVEGDLSLEQVFAWEPVVQAIASQGPNYEPDSYHAYHARSFGWILGELVRRVSGQSFGDYLAENIAKPLGLDLFVGLPEPFQARVTRVYPDDAPAPDVEPNSYSHKVMTGPSGLFSYGDIWNAPALQAAEMPSSNAIGTARSLAKLMAATIGKVDGVRLLSDATRESACRVASNERDRVMQNMACFGQGFMLAPMFGNYCGKKSFGHTGAGGCFVLVDPEQELSFVYTPNRMRMGLLAERRRVRLLRALYGCLT